MTFQDKRHTGENWNKVKTKRKLMHPKDTIAANVPDGVIKQVEPKVEKK